MIRSLLLFVWHYRIILTHCHILIYLLWEEYTVSSLWRKPLSYVLCQTLVLQRFIVLYVFHIFFQIIYFQVLDAKEALMKVQEGGYSFISFKNYISVIVASQFADNKGQTPFYISNQGIYIQAAFGWGFRWKWTLSFVLHLRSVSCRRGHLISRNNHFTKKYHQGNWLNRINE